MRACLSRLWLAGIWTLISLTACDSDDSTEPEVQFPFTTSVVSFDTVTFSTTTAFLQGEPRTASRITGELILPGSNEERLPAVILMHGAGGVSNTDRQWVDELSIIGLATFLVDSLTGRSLTGVDSMRALTRIVDAYQALAVLAQHPRIDASRIALMGRSQGGSVALYGSVERFQRLYKATEATFAGYVPLYPCCNYTLMQDEQRDGRPVRVFHGTADNQCAIGPCRALITRLRQLGQDVTLRAFPDVHHAFDNPFRTVFTLVSVPGRPVGASAANCAFVELPDSEFVNSETGQQFTWEDPWVHLDGGSLGDPSARVQTVREVTTFFRDILR